jgi:hypothetical protein
MRRREFIIATTVVLAAPLVHAQAISLSTLVNRTARCRMLSQRAVKAYGLVALKVSSESSRTLLSQCIKEFRDVIGEIDSVSRGRAFASAKAEFSSRVLPFINQLSQPPERAKFGGLTETSDKVLEAANQMVIELESAASAQTIKIVNTAGRQRMLTQRMARYYLQAEAGADSGIAAANIERDRKLFAESQDQLAATPFSSAEIKSSLDKSRQLFSAYATAATQAGKPEAMASQSETILAELDRLTQLYEVAVKAVLG